MHLRELIARVGFDCRGCRGCGCGGLLCRFSFVYFGVPFALVRSRKATTARLARVRLFAGVRSNVRRQVIGTRKTSHADLTLKRLLTRVRSHVTRQLVGSREALLAIVDGASERSLGNGRRRGAHWRRMIRRALRFHFRRSARRLLIGHLSQIRVRSAVAARAARAARWQAIATRQIGMTARVKIAVRMGCLWVEVLRRWRDRCTGT